MGFWNVIAAGLAPWVIGLIWYRRFGARRATSHGRGALPNGRRVLIAVFAAVALIVVAGFLRHIFYVSNLTSGIALALVAGMGVGLFFIAPWLWILNLIDGRAARTTLIDGGFATLGTAVMGALLVAF